MSETDMVSSILNLPDYSVNSIDDVNFSQGKSVKSLNYTTLSENTLDQTVSCKQTVVLTENSNVCKSSHKIANVKFVAGNISNYFSQWKKLTNDQHILETVKGCKIEFEQAPYQLNIPPPSAVSENEALFIDSEVAVMIDKVVIIPSSHKEGEFISGIFLVPKNEEGKFL